MDKNTSDIGFRRFGIITITAIYLLILVGGVVRSTGSGMGCPDWPKCFGQWVPPTEESQLPSNYKDIYAGKRKVKNLKLASYFDAMGLSELSYAIAHDPAIYIEPTFNPTKTWIEYLNRLLGALIGLFVIATFLYSWRFRQKDITIVTLSALSVILVGFQGWLGSVVVSTNLLPFVITLHMVLAIVIVGLLIYVIARSQRNNIHAELPANTPTIQKLIYLTMFLSLVQIILGTQVREGVDAVRVAAGNVPATEIVEKIGLVFYVHRSFSIVFVLVNVYLSNQLRKANMLNDTLMNLQSAIMLIIGIELVTGIIMAYFNVPAYAQPIHLTFGSLIIGLQLLMAVLLRFYQQKTVVQAKQVAI
jgi:cytochrome c oxidase assembly protein subunit 15